MLAYIAKQALAVYNDIYISYHSPKGRLQSQNKNFAVTTKAMKYFFFMRIWNLIKQLFFITKLYVHLIKHAVDTMWRIIPRWEILASASYVPEWRVTSRIDN